MSEFGTIFDLEPPARRGPRGRGVPGGGATGEALVKSSDASFDTEWGSVGFVGAFAFRSGTAQSIADNTLTAVQFNAEDFDTDGFHDNVTNNTRLTIPAGVDGKVRVSGVIGMFGTAGSYREVRVRLNGTTDAQAANMAPAAFGRYPFSAVLSVAEGDFVEIYVRQDSGGALDVQALREDTQVAIEFLGT